MSAGARRVIPLLAATLALGGVGCPRPPAPKPPRWTREAAPAPAYASFLRGMLWLGKSKVPEALKHLRLALAKDPRSPYLRLRLAEILSSEGRESEALRLVRQAARLAPTYYRSYLVHGVLISRTKPRAAIPLLRRAIALHPRGKTAWLALASLYARLGDRARERESYIGVLHYHADHTGALLGLARAETRAGRPTKARPYLRRFIAKRPFEPLPRLLLARGYLIAGDVSLAIRTLERALEATADDVSIALELFRVLLDQRQVRRARDLLALLSAHASAAYYTFTASLYDRLGDEAVVRKFLRRALSIDRQYAPAISAHVKQLVRRGELAAAEAFLRTYRKKDKAFVATRVRLAELHANEGRWAQAFAVLEAARKHKPKSAELTTAMASLYAKRRDVVRARRWLRRTVELSHADWEQGSMLYMRALLLDDAKAYAAAEKLGRRLVARRPDDEQALNLLGYGLAERGVKLDEAVRLLKSALRFTPLSPYILDSLGWAYFQQGKLKEARRLLTRALRIHPRMSEPWHHLGDVLVRLRARKAAADAYRRALAERPTLEKRRAISAKLARLVAGTSP